MDQEQQRQIEKWLDVIQRRNKLILTCTLLGMIAGLGTYLVAPKTYETIALIRYQQQSINPSKMSPDVATRIKQMVSTVSQEVTSRSSLETLIKRFDLYPAAREKLPMEDVVEMMRQNHITISQKKGDIFTVSYRGSNPDKVMIITNELASRFIEENLRFREERAAETSAYIIDELQMAKKALDRKETTMRDYKLKFYNEMPSQQQVNFSMLSSLKTQWHNMQTSIQDVERTKILIQEQIMSRKDVLRLEKEKRAWQAGRLIQNQSMEARADQDPLVGQNLSLTEAKNNLEILLRRYSAKHPSVKRLQREIADLEHSLAGQQFQSKQDKVTQTHLPAETVNKSPSQETDSQLEQLKLQLKDAEYEISKLQKEKEKTIRDISQYEAWVKNTPVREAEWSALTRDYNQLNQHYQGLVSQNLTARSAQMLERRQKGSQFKIVDSAHFPEKPVSPDFYKIILLYLGIGLGIGGGISVGLELLTTSFSHPDELAQYEIPVLCAIPKMVTKTQQRRRKLFTLLWLICFCLASIALAVAVVYLTSKGHIIF